MAALVPEQRMTADELLRLPADGMRHELVQGEMTTMAPAGAEHGFIAAELAASLSGYARRHDLGRVFAAETGFRIASDPDTVRAPDVAFVSASRLAETGIPRGFWPGAPDLAVEVLSPSDSYAEMEAKVYDWLDAGAQMVWIVNPKTRSITTYDAKGEVRVFRAKDTLDGAEVLPGWRITVGEVFPEPVG